MDYHEECTGLKYAPDDAITADQCVCSHEILGLQKSGMLDGFMAGDTLVLFQFTGQLQGHMHVCIVNMQKRSNLHPLVLSPQHLHVHHYCGSVVSIKAPITPLLNVKVVPMSFLVSRGKANNHYPAPGFV